MTVAGQPYYGNNNKIYVTYCVLNKFIFPVIFYKKNTICKN